MKLPENIKEIIINALKPVEPYRVILFGSYARGSHDEQSDIDLYVITRDEYIPSNFKEKMRIKRRISARLLDLMKKYPIDLIVHTKAMHDKFVGLDSSFSNEIMNNGSIIYEKNIS